MHKAVWGALVVACMVSAGIGAARAAEEATGAQPAADPAMEAAMAAMEQYGTPGEAHKALAPFVGEWTYTAQWWMAPDGPPQAMAGTATNTLLFGGRFLKQEIRGEAEGQPPFEGLGYTGYDNLRKEYRSVWLDNMATGLMTTNGQFDAATSTLSDQGDFSCPLTGETHRKYRSVWKVVDPDHTTYETYMSTPEGQEFKSMAILYTRRPAGASTSCAPGVEQC